MKGNKKCQIQNDKLKRNYLNVEKCPLANSLKLKRFLKKCTQMYLTKYITTKYQSNYGIKRKINSKEIRIKGIEWKWKLNEHTEDEIRVKEGRRRRRRKSKLNTVIITFKFFLSHALIYCFSRPLLT